MRQESEVTSLALLLFSHSAKDMSTFWVVPKTDAGAVGMGFRFRRSIGIIPGLKLNISKSGISTSIGGRGATINFSRRGTRTTVGIPGTGLSYSTLSSADGASEFQPASSFADGTKRNGGCALSLIAILGFAIIVAIFSNAKNPAPPAAVQTKAVAEQLVVTASALNCRAAPIINAPRVAVLAKGQNIAVYQAKRQNG